MRDISSELFRWQPSSVDPGQHDSTQDCVDFADRHITASSFSSLMSSTTWVPSLDGEALSPCRWYDEVVLAGNIPLEDAWRRKSVMPGLNGASDPVAIWESVLALWRLRSCEEFGAEDPVWRKHLRAWLVHKNLLILKSFIISPSDSLRWTDSRRSTSTTSLHPRIPIFGHNVALYSRRRGSVGVGDGP